MIDKRDKQYYCQDEARIRADMATANYGGHNYEFEKLTWKLTEHRKNCPTCHGVELYTVLFGPNTVVCNQDPSC